jgi:hypothetical protein
MGEGEIKLAKENVIDLTAAIMAAGIVINTSTHEEHADATLRIYYELRDKMRDKEGIL